MSRPAVEVLHVGSASRDLADDDPRGWRLGGAVVYAALTTARLGLRTAAVVGVDGPASTATELDALRAAGVDLLAVRLAECPVFRNTETPAGRVQLALAPGVPLEPVDLPEAWRAARGWALVPVADEVPESWVARIPDTSVVAVGWQGLLRTIVGGERVARRPPGANALLSRADLVGLSHHDVPPATPLRELAGLLAPGARLLVTQGDRGGLQVTGDPSGRPLVVRYPPSEADREADPTGAGDTFLAALLATAVQPALADARERGPDGADLHFAAAAGSLGVEALGLGGVPDLAAVRRRVSRDGPLWRLVPSDDTTVA
jgi:sugar/nucleoside kinase (ribokinase family)